MRNAEAQPLLKRTPQLGVVMFSSQPWDDTWTNKQHIASRLADNGHTVVYIEPNVDNITFEFTLLGRWADYFKGKSKCPKPYRRIKSGLWVFTPPYFSPRRFSFNKWLTRWFFKNRVIGSAFCFLREVVGTGTPIIAWIYPPEVTSDVLPHKYDLLVFDCVDDIPMFPHYQDNSEALKKLLEQQELLLKESDLVFATAAPLAEKLRKIRQEVHLVHNVADISHFATAKLDETKIPRDLRDMKKPILGYIGAVGRFKLDVDLIKQIATKRPDWNFAFVGSVDIGEPAIVKLFDLPNVFSLGRKPYEELPGYIKGFDVCHIPFKVSEINASSFPIKFFEYMASGKPIVTTPIASLADYTDLVPMPDSVDGYISAIEGFLDGADPNRSARMKLAENNTWENRISLILDKIYEKLGNYELINEKESNRGI